MKKILLVVTLGLALAGCASTQPIDKDAQATQDWSVEKLYTEAQDELNSRNYTRALKLYELLQSRFPTGIYAQQARLDAAYAYYKDEQPAMALADAVAALRIAVPVSVAQTQDLKLAGGALH